MKLKSVFAAAAFCVALCSCGPKEQPLSEQLVGQWTGMDSIIVTAADSTGAPVVSNFVLPIGLEYLSDSTFTAVITVNDSTSIKVEGIANVQEAQVNFAGTMACPERTMDLSGSMSFAGVDTLTVLFNASNAEQVVSHSGKAILIRKAN